MQDVNNKGNAEGGLVRWQIRTCIFCSFLCKFKPDLKSKV